MDDLKQDLYRFCLKYINSRLSRIQARIKGLQESLNSETKSSAGDKHETGRAMLQLEREKLGQQLLEAERTRQDLSRVQLNRRSQLVGLGGLIKTSKAYYFLAISAGEYQTNDGSVYCISTNSPIGKLLLGKSVNDTFVFNNEEVVVLEIM